MNQHTVEYVLSLMSPTTLAGLIADIQALDKGAEGKALRIEALAVKALDANVGERESERLVLKAMDAIYAA